MKKILFILSLFLLTTNNSFSQKSNLNIAIINIKEVLGNSLAMQKLQKKLQQKEGIYQEEINKKQSNLQSEISRIESKKSILSEAALKKEEEKFSKKFSTLKTEFEQKQKTLQNSYNQSMSDLDQKIKEIIAKIREEKNIDLVLPASLVIDFESSLDISALVLKTLNKEVKDIDINFN